MQKFIIDQKPNLVSSTKASPAVTIVSVLFIPLTRDRRPCQVTAQTLTRIIRYGNRDGLEKAVLHRPSPITGRVLCRVRVRTRHDNFSSTTSTRYGTGGVTTSTGSARGSNADLYPLLKSKATWARTTELKVNTPFLSKITAKAEVGNLHFAEC